MQRSSSSSNARKSRGSSKGGSRRRTSVVGSKSARGGGEGADEQESEHAKLMLASWKHWYAAARSPVPESVDDELRAARSRLSPSAPLTPFVKFPRGRPEPEAFRAWLRGLETDAHGVLVLVGSSFVVGRVLPKLPRLVYESDGKTFKFPEDAAESLKHWHLRHDKSYVPDYRRSSMDAALELQALLAEEKISGGGHLVRWVSSSWYDCSGALASDGTVELRFNKAQTVRYPIDSSGNGSAESGGPDDSWPSGLAYGGGVGARVALTSADSASVRCGTLGALQPDGRYEVLVDNVRGSETLDPRPANSRAARSFGFSKGDRVLVLHKGELVDAAVVERKSGNRHRLEILPKNDPPPPAVEPTPAFPTAFPPVPDAEAAEKPPPRKPPVVLMDLNEVNHAEGSMFASEYQKVLSAYCMQMLEQYWVLEDTITGKRLNVEKQVMRVNAGTSDEGVAGWSRETAERVSAEDRDASGQPLPGLQRPAYERVRAVHHLVKFLVEPSQHRAQGRYEAQPILICAESGTGKTWAVRQLLYYVAKAALPPGQVMQGIMIETPGSSTPPDLRLVPLMINAQRLARWIKLEAPDLSTQLPLMDYVEWEESLKQYRQLLERAHALRTLVVFVDGIDEAAGLRDFLENWLLNTLLPHGVRVVATCRPDGVRRRLYARHWIIANLVPLDDEDQLQAARAQVKNHEFFEHLVTTAAIRAKHDMLYESTFAAGDRLRIESVRLPDGFRLSGKRAFDPSMRQRSAFGQELREARGKSPKSAYLSALHSELNASNFLEKLGDEIIHLAPDAKEAAIRELVASCADPPLGRPGLNIFGAEESLRVDHLAVKLGVLALRQDLSPCKLWEDIWRRTDELYVVTEQCAAVFEQAMRSMLNRAGLSNDGIVIGPIKDPMRAHEKAMDEYVDRVFEPQETFLPEACITDMIRLKAICTNPETMLEIMTTLRKGFEMEIDGVDVRIEFVRIQNNFPSSADAFHFRSFLVNMRVMYKHLATYGEVQVHHKTLLDHDNSSETHKHRDYFRSMLSGEHNLNDKMIGVLEFLTYVLSDPTLLSMLILTILAHKGEARVALPSNRLELYELASSGALLARMKQRRGKARADLKKNSKRAKSEEASVLRMLRAVAAHVQIEHLRVFDTEDVRRALADQPGLLDAWNFMVSEPAGLPLVRALTADAGKSEPAKFEFKHISMQEALFCLAIERREIDTFWNSGSKEAKLNDPFYDHAFWIGEERLNTALAEIDDNWELKHEFEGASGKPCKFSAMASENGQIMQRFAGAVGLRRLCLAGVGLEGEIPSTIGYCVNLEHCDFSNNLLSGVLPIELLYIMTKTDPKCRTLLNNNPGFTLPLDLDRLGSEKLKNLDLSQCSLQSVLPFTLLRMLAEGAKINLSGNIGITFPSNVTDLGDDLKVLPLNDCSLSGRLPLAVLRMLTKGCDVQLKDNLGLTLPPEIGELGRQRELDLSSCSLKGESSQGARVRCR